MTGRTTTDEAQDTRLRALRQVRFSWAATADDVWQPSAPHVEGVQQRAEDALYGGMEDAWRSGAPSPVGLALQGQKGVGKTHLLGWIRDRVQRGNGYFFLVQLLDGTSFWRSAVHGVLDGLLRPAHGHRDQLTLLLTELAGKVEAGPDLRAVLLGEAPPARDQLDAFVARLARLDRQIGMEAQDTARALVLYAALDMRAQEVGRSYLSLGEEIDADERALWGMRRSDRSPQLVLRDLSRLMALTDGPTVVAIDQIDTLFAQSRRVAAGDADVDPALDRLVNQVADGLMGLREETRRTLSVVTCLPVSWALIRDRAADTVRDRFAEHRLASTLPSADVARHLVRTRLAARYEQVRFEPPYPTWPVTPEAFATATQFTARGLLQRIDTHIQSCLDAGEVHELPSLDEAERPAAAEDHRPETVPESSALVELDGQFERLCAAADVGALGDPAREDVEYPRLLAAVLACLRAELGPAGEALEVDPEPGTRQPPLHARLRLVLDPETEDEEHWAFRAVLASNARSVQSRIRHAEVAAGLQAGVGTRRLVVLRNTPWPSGKRTRETIEQFAAAGGVERSVGDDDLRTFAALRAMLDADPYALRAWLRSRRPVSQTELVRSVLREVVALAESAPPLEAARPHGATPDGKVTAVTPAVAGEETPVRGSAAPGGVTAEPVDGDAPEGMLPLGVTLAGRRPFHVTLESLRRHVAVFAGSGSGKTVLLRRIVEECALQGVSSIVLDPNNDLARLGDAWPEPPPAWGVGDAGKAGEYLDGTDVVVWTPGRSAGRPLAFQPLPDFRPVLGDEDEFRDAVDAAVDSLAPRAASAWSSRTADQGHAVLRETLRHFAREEWTTLPELVQLLRDLPDGITTMSKGRKLAHDMADALTAAQTNDPLFGGSGEPVDPGALLTPAAGRRARVSVISLVGLPSTAQRQSFVNQLQMALFAWIKRNPATDRPLGGLLVLDEAPIYAPSRGKTAASQSTVVLAAQARKYGLGLVFATQAPKDLDNRIPGNASTQLFGTLNSPTQIGAARELARAKGGDVEDIARLATGQFYAAVTGRAFEKVATPLCLTHHPASPLTPEEVIARAAAGRDLPRAAYGG